MKSLKIIIIMLIGVIIYSCGDDEERQTDQTVSVRTADVQKSTLSKPIITSGKIETTLESKLSFKVGGIIEEIRFQEGDQVNKGQVIASIDLSEIKANVAKAEEAYEKAKREYERVNNLYEDEVVTLEQFQNAETALKVAESDLEIAKFNLNHSVIKAPSNGTVLQKFVVENELVNPGYPVVLFGSKSKNWKLKAALSDQNIVKLNIGDSAAIKFDAFPDEKLSGRVTVISKSANPYNGAYEIEVNLDETDLNLSSGMIGEVEFMPASLKEYHFVPIEALLDVSGDSGSVFIPDNSTAKKVVVQIETILEDRAVISSGLEGVSIVITDGTNYLSDGSKIEIVN